MNISHRLDRLHLWFRQNRWLLIYTWATRILLAYAFIFAGYVKIIGERFTDLHNKQPMGHYLQALFDTGYYYTSIGIAQVLAGVLILVPRTRLLGVLIYLPIIFNITVLSWSVRFEGSLFTSPLMVIACVYLLWWDYDRVKYILPYKGEALPAILPKQPLNNSFPWVFSIVVLSVLIGVTAFSMTIFDVMPRNTLSDCTDQFIGTTRTRAGKVFCDCVHDQGNILTDCMTEYFNLPDDGK
tara:strand:- start:36220 stop:36939 length:720 start_codon:yes stop_codon:yes gene_type:complete